MNTEDVVLVGTDGSPPAQAAVRWATEQAQRRGATLEVVHAYEEIWGADRHLPRENLLEVARNHAEVIVADAETAAHEIADGVALRGVAEVGAPVATLLQAATRATLVVVGNRGLGGFAGLLLGSVGQGVATHAPCPAVVVRGRSTAAQGPVAVGADGSDSGSHAVGLAFEEAASRGCALLAVRTYGTSVPPSSPDLLALNQQSGQEDAAEREALRGLLTPWCEKYPQVPIKTLVSRDDAARLLVDVSHTAQLVIVGNRGRGTLAGTLLGSVGLKLLHHADCPVMIAHS